MERFKGISPHRPLDEGATKIRIINLLPGEFGDPIECVLEHIDMEDTKDYEALSYCWGEPSITKPILLDSKSYPVTTNLFDGLQRLRKSDGPRKLWIDSLCINQSDVPERSREIRKMWSIYEKSKGVIVWLGECLPWSEATVQAIFNYVTDLGQSWDPVGKVANGVKQHGHSEVVERYGYTELWNQHLRMNEFLRQRQWFERTWVIQEIAVKSPYRDPEICPILLCGTLRLSMHYMYCMNLFWKTLPPDYGSLKILRVYEPLHRQLEMCKGFSIVRWDSRLPPARQLILYLVDGAAVLRTTDPRDQIYGILGLLQHSPLPDHLTPDYGKSLQQVLVEYGKYLLEETQCTDIIQYNSRKTPDLPSWVPDWKHKPGPNEVGTKETTPMSFCIMDGKLCLRIDYIPLDVIQDTRTDTIHYIKQDTPLQFVADYLDSASKWLYGRMSNDRHASLHDIRFLVKTLILGYDYLMELKPTRFWHQLIVDAGPSYTVGDEHTFRRKEVWMDILQRSPAAELDLITNSDMKAGIARVWCSVAETIRDKAIFLCATGSVGIMEQMDVQPQPGDIIGGIRGATCEFVLRPCSHNGHYSIIGQCHRSDRGRLFNIMNIAIGNLSWKGKYHLDEVFSGNLSQKIILC